MRTLPDSYYEKKKLQKKKEVDSEGWIKRTMADDGICPCHPFTQVEIKLRGGDWGKNRASEWGWHYTDDPANLGTIVEWRLAR